MNKQNNAQTHITNWLFGAVGVAVITLGGAVMAAPASANVLDFSGNICSGPCADFGTIEDTYGDIAGVVDISYRNLLGNTGVTNLRYWSTAYNDLVDVAWTDGGDTTSRGEIYIQPLNGQAVTLNSFDLGAWIDTTRTSTYTILDGAMNILFESGSIEVGSPPDHSHYDFVGLTSLDGIRIQWGPSAFNVGIDNINYSFTGTPVPLPPGAALLGAGLLALLKRRRREA